MDFLDDFDWKCWERGFVKITIDLCQWYFL